MTPATNRRPLIAAGLLLGVGMGGFVDGILFHQILQWHNMLSAKYPPAATDVAVLRRNVEVNMFWDGLFHALTWTTTLVGLHLLFRAGQRADVPWSRPTLGGAMLLGWGLFNLVEGVIDHHLLHVHHVREDLGVSAWDYGFLAAGVGLLAVGWLVLRAGRGDETPRGSTDRAGGNPGVG